MTYKKDLRNQTSYTIGVSDSKYTAASINVLVDALNDNRGALVTAAAQAVGQHGVNHPDNANLPLRTASARALGYNRALVTMRYAHEPNTLFYGTLNAFNLATIQIGQIGVDKWEVKAGKSYTDFDNWFRWTKAVPVLILSASGAGTASPLGTVFSRSGKTNSDTVTWSGYTIPINRVRFDDFIQRGRNVNGTEYFTWDYTFTIRPDSWIREYPSTTSATPGTAVIYDTATFANQFPLT